jgi:hypothetical protein
MTNSDDEITSGRVWWAQIKAVIRLEMKKTFFAKRGLWIYLVAAAGFSLHGLRRGDFPPAEPECKRRAARRESATYQDLLAVKPGMTREEVVAILGKPPVNFIGGKIAEKIGRQSERGRIRRRNCA